MWLTNIVGLKGGPASHLQCACSISDLANPKCCKQVLELGRASLGQGLCAGGPVTDELEVINHIFGYGMLRKCSSFRDLSIYTGYQSVLSHMQAVVSGTSVVQLRSASTCSKCCTSAIAASQLVLSFGQLWTSIRKRSKCCMQRSLGDVCH